jgi:hypothetical protein
VKLDQYVLEAFEATSLILVFVTVLFNLKYQNIINDLNSDIESGKRAKEKQKKQFIRSFLINCCPPLLLNCSALYLFSPLSLKIIRTTNFKIWGFDFLPTAFMFVVIWVGVFFVWTVYLSFKMLVKIYNIDTKKSDFA